MNINDYANSMFRNEHLTDSWIEKCYDYVKFLFGDQLRGKVILDYGFGRGNWSLALLRAGAKSVLAVDASEDNVFRFSEYCNKHKIDTIKIIRGNILEQPIDEKADFFWIYGILHHIDDIELFMQRLKSMHRKPHAYYYLYLYDANSLRHFIVDSCRQLLVYSSEKNYLLSMPYYIDVARKRVRDDLVAPYIKWYETKDILTLCERYSLSILQQDKDFQHFLGNADSDEFAPYQFLVVNNEGLSNLEIVSSPVQTELVILKELFSEVFKHYKYKTEQEKESLVIGLTNTYYCAQQQDVSKIYLKLFLYLINIVLTYNIQLQEQLGDYLTLTKKALTDDERLRVYQHLGSNKITRFLVKNKIRL